ncbi:MAG: hypothetical protein IH897_04080, partial [Planctomycetes bacterium]|nr:hypothetical protein [Planctomycetota bacterium]
ELAKRALGTAISYQSESALESIVDATGSSLARDAEWQVMLGAAFDYFSLFEDAAQAYRTSLAIQDDIAVQEGLARILLLLARPDEAWDLVSHIVTEKKSDRLGLPLLVAEAYQGWGMHDAALIVLDECLAAFPELETDADFKRMRKTALKYKNTDKVVKPKILALPEKKSRPGRSLSSYVPTVLALAVLLAVGGLFVSAALIAAETRKIYIVNGLSIPYRLTINGKPKNMRPKSVSSMEIREGDINISVLNDDVSIPDQTCRITTNFFSRLFVDHLFVVNPDRTALLIWEETEYAETPTPDATHPYEVHCGELLLSMTDIDFPFQKFPNTVALPSGSAVKRSRLGFLNDLPATTIAAVVSNSFNSDGLASFVRRTAEYDKDDATFIGMLVGVLAPEEAYRSLEKLSKVRPVRVEAHRGYQTLTERLKPDVDLVGEYRELLAEMPDSPQRMYLLGRALGNVDEAEALFRKATSGDEPCAYALNALAYARLTNGAFEEARQFGSRAIDAAPHNPSFRWVPSTALEALGRFEQALELERSTETPISIPVERELYLLTRKGDSAQVDEQLEAMVKEASELDQKAEGEIRRKSLQAMVAYVQGDTKTMIQLSENISDPKVRFARLMTMGDLDASQEAAGNLAVDKAYAMLLVSLAARATQKNEEADIFLVAAAKLLPAEGADGRKVASWLTGDVFPQVDDALRIGLMPAQKVIVMTALGFKFPEHRGKYFAMARTLNFDRRFPYLLIQSLTENPG